MQNLIGHDFHHRRALEKRQIRSIVTTVVTEPSTTYTTTFATRVPIITIPRRPTTTATSTAVSVTPSSTDLPSSAASSGSVTLRPTASSSSVVLSLPSSSITPSLTSSEPAVVTVTKTDYNTAPSGSATSDNAAGAVGAKSTGQIAGIAVGVIAGVVGLAIFAGFIVRLMRKRARDKEAWDASKFRRSALMLDDSREKPGGDGGGRSPRPPSMIERRSAASTGSVNGAPPPPSRAYPYTDGAGVAGGFNPQDQLGYNRGAGTPQPMHPQQYGAPNPYGAAPIPYTGQNMYGQGAERGFGAGYGAETAYGAAAAAAYGRGTPQPHQQQMGGMGMHHPGFPGQLQSGHQHHSLPPFAAYAPQGLGIDVSSFGTPAGNASGMAAGVARTNTTASSLPNPFSERAPPSPRDSGSSSSHTNGQSQSDRAPTPPNKPRYMTRNGDDIVGSDDAPPAYSDDGTYAKMQRDVKNPVVMTAEGTTTSSPAQAPAAPAAVAEAPAPAVPAKTTTTMGNNRARPVSSHTVYDPEDAYGGM